MGAMEFNFIGYRVHRKEFVGRDVIYSAADLASLPLGWCVLG